VSEVVANGRTFHTQEVSPTPADGGSKTSGEPVTVLVHGLLLDNLASWYFGVAPLLARDLARRVCMYDLRGHGKSEHATDGYDVETQADDLAALMDTWSPDAPIDLVGHSYGGLIAMRCTLARPQRVRRLALVDVPLPPSRMERVRDVIAGGKDAILEAIPENLRANLTSGRRRAARTLRTLQRLLTNSTLVADLRSEGDVPDDALAALALPVALIYGSTSSCLPTGERLAAVLPDAHLSVLEGGHYLPVEHSAELARVLGDFFRG
jgi:pimeloyl-ACP methyl ester carboxylesterase